MEEESHQDSPNIQLDRGELTPGDWLAFIDCFRAIVYRVDKNHLITVANSALCTYLGKSLDNIIGRDCQDVFGEAIGELHQELNEKVFQTREAIEREEIIVDRQGIEGFFLVRRKYYVDAAGRKHVVVVARDSMELRECREQYRAIFEATTEAMLVFDSHGIVVEANYTASKLFGYPKEEILGLEGKDLVDPKHYDILHDFQKQLELDIDKEFLICTMSRRSDGTILEVEVRATKFIFRGKKSLLVIVNDVTERKKMERDLLRSQQLDTLGVLAGGIAHDFNNMLTVISMAISMTRMVCSDDERVRRNLDQASRATEIARQQTLRLLTFAKGGSPVKETACIQDLTKASSELILIGSNCVLEFWAAEDVRLVEIDHHQMSQVINNLVRNASEAMPDGGTIQVKVENHSHDGKGLLPAGEYVMISIEDQGEGISEDNLPKIFDPYFSTKQEGRESRGLGLTSAFSVVRKHDGLITVESRIGVGTTFRILLPASKKQRIKSRAERPVKIFPKGGERILFMDDEELIRLLVGEILTTFGFEVEFAKTGLGAIQIFLEAREDRRPFDLVIFDLVVPGGMGGEKTMAKLLEIDPSIKGIVTSGYSAADVMANFADYGFRAAIPKPFDKDSLYEAIRRVLDQE